MNRPVTGHLLRGALVLTLLLWAGSCRVTSPGSSEAARRPNVVLVMADDLGWADVGFRGHPILRTPHLDAMAAEGVSFERFYAAAPVCSPTRASALTGRHPFRIGIRGANSGRMPDEEHTLAEALRSVGYRTGFFGKWHLGTLTTEIEDANRGGPGSEEVYAPPWEHGFDVSFATESKVPTWNPMFVPAEGCGHRAGAGKKAAGDPYGTYYWTGAGERATANLAGDNSRVIMDRVVPFLEAAARDRTPFFTVVWFHTPHLPTISGGKFLETYAAYSEDERHYYGSITAMDEEIGRLRATLDRLGIADDTMLWFCSDNGPERNTPGSAGPLRARKRSLYEGGIRVPGVLVWPGGVAGGRTIGAPCGTSDYVPTIASLVGLELDARRPYDGIDISPLLSGEVQERGRPIGFQYGNQRCWLDGDYKLYRKGERPPELYDLASDVGERTDLATSKPDVVERMNGELERWQASCRASAQGADYP